MVPLTAQPTSTYVQLFGGTNNGCGVGSSGAAVCWGLSDDRQADGTWSNVQAIVPATSSICAVSASGLVDCVCWGIAGGGYVWFDGSYGVEQLVSRGYYGGALRTIGTLTFDGKTLTKTLILLKPKAITGGDQHVCGITQSNGTGLCWANSDETCGAASVPTRLGSVRLVAAGNNHACAMQSTGSATGPFSPLG